MDQTFQYVLSSGFFGELFLFTFLILFYTVVQNFFVSFVLDGYEKAREALEEEGIYPKLKSKEEKEEKIEKDNISYREEVKEKEEEFKYNKEEKEISPEFKMSFENHPMLDILKKSSNEITEGIAKFFNFLEIFLFS